MTPDVSSRAPDAAIDALLADAHAFLTSTSRMGSARPSRRAIKTSPPGDLDEAIRQLDRRVRELEVDLAAAREIRTRADELEEAATSSDVVLKRVRRELSETFETDPLEGGERWFDEITELLSAWRIEALGSLVDTDVFPFVPGHRGDAALVRDGVAALAGDVARALPMVDMLASRDRPKLTSEQARLLAFAARIHLSVLNDAEGARALVDRAHDLDDRCAVARSAMGEVLRSLGRQEDALRCFEESIRMAPGEPDGYTGLGLLAEDMAASRNDRSAWDQAEHAYDSAVIAAGRGAIARRLLAPAPANLHLQCARLLAREDDKAGALDVYEQALALGVRGAGDHPDRKARKEQGELLADLNRFDVAAEAFYEAGWRYAETDNLKQAEKILRRALKCSPEHRDAHWFLADVLRVKSGREPVGQARQEIVSEAIGLWDRAFAAGPLPDPLPWVYPSRALLAEQQGATILDRSVVSESWMYFEFGLVHAPDNSWALVHLARQYRYLGLHANARAAVATAAAEATDRVTMELLSDELLEQGDWAGAASVAQELTQVAPDVGSRVNLAWVLLCSDGPDAALAEALDALSLAPDSGPARELVAHASYLVGDLDAARQHASMLWSNRPDLKDDLSPGRTGWWGFLTDDLAGAARAFEHAIASGSNRGAMLRDFGQVQLAAGDLDEADRSLTAGIDSIRSMLEVRTMQLELERLESVAATWPRAEAAQAIVARARDRLESSGSRFAATDEDPSNELEAALLDDSRDATFRLAAQLTQARLLRQDNLNRQAALIYREIVATGEHSAADVGLRQLVDGEVLLLLRGRIDDWSGAAASIAELVDLARPTIDNDEAFALRLLAPAVVIGAVVHDVESVRDRLSLAFGAVEGSGHVVEAFSEAVVRLQVDDSVAWAIYDDMIDLSSTVTADEFVCSAIGGVLGLQAHRAAAQTTPIVDPAVLDLGIDLYPDGPEAHGFFKRLQPFYDHIAHDTGVDIPAIPLVRVDSLEPSSYVIKVDETAVARGRQPPHDGQSSSMAALEAVLDHLEAVLRRLLATFVGVSTVDLWIEDYVTEGGDRAILDRFRADASVRVGFVRLLQSLVHESVPITDRASIVDVVRDAKFQRIDSLTDPVRKKLSTTLVTDRHRARRAPTWLEDELSAHCTVGKGDPRVPRATAGALIDRLRSWGRDVDQGAGRVVLTTSNVHLRLAMWHVASAALSSVSVLVVDEVDP